MNVPVKTFAFVFHVVTDVARARKFYEQVLGLTIGKEGEFSPGKWWIEYDVAGQALAISNAIPGGPTASLYLEVSSLEQSLEVVRAAGVEIAFELMEFPSCRMFAIKDPDGNQIGLHQLKSDA